MLALGPLAVLASHQRLLLMPCQATRPAFRRVLHIQDSVSEVRFISTGVGRVLFNPP